MNKVYLVVVNDVVENEFSNVLEALIEIKQRLSTEFLENIKLYEAVEKTIKIAVE